MTSTKKRKVDSENRQFKPDWTDQFCFILPQHQNAKPTCLICMQTVSVCKADNIKRHFNTMHAASFNSNFPEKSDHRRQKIASMHSSFRRSVFTIETCNTAQQRARAASLRVSWNLGRAKKPFTDAVLIKECAIDMVEELLRHDEKNKLNIVDLLKQVPLSANSATRRIEVLAEDCSSRLNKDLIKTEAMSLAIDSSCDRTDMEQLSVFARYFDGNKFREELLCLLPLSGRTTGEIIFNELTQFFAKTGLDVAKVVSVVTDGAPSMVGHRKGLVSRLSAINPELLTFHCIIHQSVLCAKLGKEMKEVMDTVTRLVNFVRENSSLQHRIFRALLEEMSAEHTDLLLHNDVRWLSKGRVLERVCDLHGELVSFFSSLTSQKAHEFHAFLIDKKEMACVCFLSDIMSHLNHLNLQLQGKNHTVADMYEAIDAFQAKLSLLERDIRGRKLHFPRLRQHCEKNDMRREDPALTQFVTNLTENFKERFENNHKLSRDILLFLRQPFSASPDGQWTSEAKKLLPSIDEPSLQMEVLEMKTSDVLKAYHKETGLSEFWINVDRDRFKNTRSIAMLLLTIFPSTYICESSFSAMNCLKNQARNRLSDAQLGECLKIATTEYRPDFRNIASSSNHCHFSH
ncbi:protein FAM200A [Misgurnus anguillicaudatus]|uniref:protein FAM200A n=1 Tax=Misgurnus anguillicaudatus TaxID=75329 RepID=UPI003CCFB53F